MFEGIYFLLGLLNSLFLISIFIIRKTNDISLIKKIGKLYIISMTIVATFEIIVGAIQQIEVQYMIFLVIFLAYLLLEVVYDYILKLDFRNNWKLLVPYLCLYYAMNYGFVIMVWKTSLTKGMILLALFIIQIVTNIISHSKKN